MRVDRIRKKARPTARLILTHFGGDKEKANKWLTSRQKILGGLIPADMIKNGREKKLRSKVRIWLEELYG